MLDLSMEMPEGSFTVLVSAKFHYFHQSTSTAVVLSQYVLLYLYDCWHWHHCGPIVALSR
jgi:hypothetical protein